MSDRTSAADNSASPRAGALDGIRVVDLARFIAGPYCAMLLGDMGADVVKAEPPGRGENSRTFGPFVKGESLYTMVFNRNKRSLTLDLRSEQGKDVLRDLLRKADVLVENFVPGTLEKMGLDWDTLKNLNPRLIVLGGLFGRIHPYVAEEIDRALRSRSLAPPVERLSVVPSALGVDAPLLGAAEHAFQPLLDDPAGWVTSDSRELQLASA